jgi:hypothetical protein
MTMTAASCFVHIGAPKTGTTLLQRFLFDNRAALLEQGLLYPEVSLRGYGHHDLAFLVAGGYPEWATPQSRTLAELITELAAAVCRHDDDILLSSEDFYLFAEPRALANLLAQADISRNRRTVIIVYVRRQDLAHESWHNQTVKAQGATHDLGECMRHWWSLWDYREQLARWAAVFGRDGVVVRSFEAGQFSGGSLVTDFLEILGVMPQGLTLPTGKLNTALNRDLLEYQRLVNRLPLAVAAKRRFHKELIELTAQTAGSGLFDDRPLLEARQRREILAAYKAGNDEVAKTYLHRDELFLESLDERDFPEPTGLTTEKLAYIVGWLMARDREDTN